jgi:hypothetical protein
VKLLRGIAGATETQRHILNDFIVKAREHKENGKFFRIHILQVLGGNRWSVEVFIRAMPYWITSKISNAWI